MEKVTVKKLLKVILRSFVELSKNDPLRMAGATAFFTTFALPPILILLLQLFGLVVNKGILNAGVWDRLSGIFGEEPAKQVIRILYGFESISQKGWVLLLGMVFLLFVATTLFKIIKDSLNQI